MKRPARLTVLAILYALLGVVWCFALRSYRTILPHFERWQTEYGSGHSYDLGLLIPLIIVVCAFAAVYGFWKTQKWATIPGITVLILLLSTAIVPFCLGVPTGLDSLIMPLLIIAVFSTLTAFSWRYLH